MLTLSRDEHLKIVGRLRAGGCVFAEDEARLLIESADSHDHLRSMLEQRTLGFPLEHVVGWADFCGIRMQVTPGVFVPRPRSELLVRAAVDLVRTHRREAIVLDVCCGCGAVGAAIAAFSSNANVHAVELDPIAVRCARANISSGTVYEGNLYEALPLALHGRVDVLVANAPYVPTNEIDLLPPEARLYEPLLALDGGSDGLDVQRQIVAGAGNWLTPQGHLLVETGAHQAAQTAEIFARNGFVADIVRSDDIGATVVIGSVRPTTSRGAQSSS